MNAYRSRPGASVDKIAEQARIKAIIRHVSRSRAAEAAGLSPASLQQWLRVGGRLKRARESAEKYIRAVRKRWCRRYPKLSHEEVAQMFSACRTPWVITYALKRERELRRRGVL